jgi:hypothetical protein
MLSYTKVDRLAVKLEEKLRLLAVNQLANKSGFVSRKPRKIKPLQFLLGFFFMMLTDGKSLTSFATSVGLLSKCTISKQAIDKRMNARLVTFLEMILATILSNKLNPQTTSLMSTCSSHFHRIFVEDSTNIALHKKLVNAFPGSRNITGKKFAILKIQAVVELVSEQFYHFFLSPFCRNDQAAAFDILPILNNHDLIIRDLGYFVLGALQKVIQKGAYFISRLKYDIIIYTQDGKNRIHLLKMLREYGQLDCQVRLGGKEKIPSRLVAIPISKQQADARRRYAKNNRDRRCKPKKEYLALLDWEIFILNIDQNCIPPKQIAEIYQLRTRIEIIFKSWKSHFKINMLPNANQTRVVSYVYAMLIFIAIFQTYVYARLYFQYQKSKHNQVSLLRLSKFFKEQVWAIMLFNWNDVRVEQQIYYHCSYEQRYDRFNYCQRKSALG